MSRQTLTALAALRHAGCASLPPDSPELFRSFSDGPNWQDRFMDMQVLHSGVRTITLKKG